VNYRANIAALKMLGVTDVLSLSAVGGLRADLPPGTFVIVDQFIDRTTQRAKVLLRHRAGGARVDGAPGVPAPGRPRRPALLGGRACRTCAAAPTWRMEGPQFSTQAESALYRSWNCSVIGMTNCPRPSSRARPSSATAQRGMVTDFDCWHPATTR
jgi:5'-methylthioadenosine phosphorylase